MPVTPDPATADAPIERWTITYSLSPRADGSTLMVAESATSRSEGVIIAVSLSRQYGHATLLDNRGLAIPYVNGAVFVPGQNAAGVPVDGPGGDPR